MAKIIGGVLRVSDCIQRKKIVQEFGLEADRHHLRCLFAAIDFTEPTSTPQHCKLLGIELNEQLNKLSLISTLCFAIEHNVQKSLKPSAILISQISKACGNSKLLEVLIALALTHSNHIELSKFAGDHLRRSLPALIESYTENETNSERSLNDISPDLLQLILSLICHGEQYINYGLSRETFEKFIKKLREDFPRERVPLIIAPFLYAESEDEIEGGVLLDNFTESFSANSRIMDTSWSNLVMEIGYAFTATVEDCKNHLVKVCGRDVQSQDVAKIIGLMCRTHTNLSECNVNLPTPANFWPGQTGSEASGIDKKDLTKATNDGTQTWKPDVFVQALKEVAPNINWKDVCVGLDHPEFVIKDRIGLNLLVTILRLTGNHTVVIFMECVYRHWQHLEGQLSIVGMILKYPDIISFADYIVAAVPMELLKTPPETDNKEIGAWKSLHLVEVLLYIAEKGYNNQVHELFKFPVQQCPDVLFMALLQISPPMSGLRQELFSTLIPTFLSNHPNSGVILHHAWNSSNFSHALRVIIMHSMSEWYLCGECDQSKLSRILDVAQDLKALSSLLNARSFLFVIDLACLASRREYLKLEKWLSDKIREHGEPFVQAIVKFLQRRCPQITGAKIPEDQIPKAAQLPHETLTTMLSCLQACAGNVQPELYDMIVQMTANCNMMIHKRQPPPPGVLRHRGLDATPFNANLNAQQMFGAAVDSMSLNTSMAGLNVGGPNSGFNFGNVFGNLVSNPASPSRLLNPASNSPFPIMSLPVAPTNVNNMGRIQPTPPTGAASPAGITDIMQTISKEVDDEANSYFQRIYNHPPHPTLSIDEVLDMLQRFKDSSVRREQEVYQCMLRNLFEEYRFFPQYPEKELQITAQLFGGIIERNLGPTCFALGLALRFVLEALRKPVGSKMYYFGITALDRFKSRLNLYNKYCEYVRSIPHFNEFPPHLIQYVEFGLQSLEPPTKPQGPVLPPSMTGMLPHQGQQPPQNEQLYRSNSVTGNIATTPTQTKPTSLTCQPIHPSRVKSIATATNIDTLLVANADREEKITIPPDSIQDKTAFIFNNLSQLNLQQKCEEIKEIMTKEYWQWLSQYLVLKRASIEFNFHTLYSNFLDALKNNELIRLVTRETFRNIRVLLRSDKGIANFSDRSLLKNLGHWLGMMTLARNRPILQIDIDLKSLVVEAYHKGQQELLYVVPFVAKVLESCAKSKVFKPPNPWTMAIMNVLAELHEEQDLKLNLKFEIEVLCKTLNIDINELKPPVYLKDNDRAGNIECQLSSKPKQDVIAMVEDQSLAQLNPASVPASSPSASSESAGQPVINPPEPRFSYVDICVNNYSTVAQNLVLSPNIAILHANPNFKHIVLGAVERTITEWLQPIVDRSVRIGVKTCEQIIRKDFALDPDENRMRTAAHYLVRNLTAGMAMITCKDQLTQALSGNIKKTFLTALNPPPQIQDAEAAAIQLASDNAELCCAFIQKTATEKAIPEIDKRLAADFEARKLARDEGRRYCDPEVLTYQAERMPEQIRLKVGIVPSTQFAVYDEFARKIPGFQPLTERDAAIFLPKTSIPELLQTNTSDELGILYAELATKMESFLHNTVNISALQLQTTKVHNVLNALIAARRHRESETAVTMLTRVVEGLTEGLVNVPDQIEPMKIYRDIHLRILNLLRSIFGAAATERAVTKCIFEIGEEYRYNLESMKLLVNSRFINIPQLDQLLSQAMDNGSNYLATTFAMQFVQHFLIDERINTPFTEQEMYCTIDLLAKLAAHHSGPEGLAHLMDLLRINHDPNSFITERPAGPSQYIHSGILHVRSSDCDDPPGLQEKTEYLLKDWFQIYFTQINGRDPVKAFGMFINKMNMYGILKTDDMITRFIRQGTQFCIELSYRNLNDPQISQGVAKTKIFQCIDAYVRLIALLVRHSGDVGNPNMKINLLNKVLGIVLGILLQDQELRSTSFQQLGYHRFFIMLFLELSAPDPVLENLMLNIVTAFCHTYHLLNPSTAPGFCYSWLELISHRVFIGRILAQIPQQKGWSMYSQLLMDLFKYLAPFLRNAELAKPVQLLYKGTLRVLLVLLHDFPEFLCDYHFGFCDVIPPNCIQMRNIILAAFPRNMRLPDPFTPNLKVDMLPETATAPRIYTDYVKNIQPLMFKKDLDSYLKARAPVTFLSELRGHLQISNEPGSRYNIPLMNALVLYVGTQAIIHIRSKNLVPNMTTIVHSAHMDIFQNLAVDLDNEGRYLFLNAIANQLRYPNSHTHYFSCAVLYLFVEANSEAIQEQITRVLLERLIVNRPHPWGLLITFIELIKNPVYKFWEHEFVHCAPEIEKLFESVARSCMVKANHQQQLANVEAELECN
ncbi:unnamed protein product [Hermetia illucens]|uniref:CCR4-NOT transcription complex subunit 1 n=1 Tax=Hermetia illucens TaxID=343691 RepID=A0A7R8U9T1_HERIL|nr:unnamed protein product [Hermetia illucens]